MELMEIKSLIGKTKPEVAAAIKANCAHSSEHDQLKLLLDNFLSSANDIDNEEVIDWLSWIVAGGSTPEEFSSTVRLYDKATTCGLVWTENFVAYRCRTCGISPCMSLCTDCFQRGNHEGHDFIIFRSETGGACDCGETNIIKESGCCSFHGPRGSHQKSTSRSRSDSTSSNDQSAPEIAELLCIASDMMPHLFYRLIKSMREEYKKLKANPIKAKPIIMTCKHTVENNNEITSSVLTKGHKFIKMLQGLADMGVAMRQVIIHSLTKVHAYLSAVTVPAEINNQYQFKTFLEELVYWTVKFEFPEDLICLLLTMRSDFVYKEEFTKAFILHYKLISETILKSMDPEKLCKHVAAVSVQLFSIEQLAITMVDQMKLLPLLVTTLHEMIDCTMMIPLNNAATSRRKVIDCDNDIMKNNYYWPIKSDLKELLSHQQVAYKFFEDEDLLGKWFKFLSHFQGMNISRYIEKGMPHLEQETETHIGAFTAELEISATPMWTLLSHLNDPTTAEFTQKIIYHCLQNLLEWSSVAPIQRGQVSFHLPLHRNLSMFIRQGLLYQGLSLEQLMPSNDEHLFIIGQQLVSLQSTFYQILGRLWSRNGTEVLNQAESYVNSLCCNSMIDADIFLLQAIAGYSPRNKFLSMVFEEFGVYNFLGIVNNNSSENYDQEEQNIVLESCLLFLATLTSSRINLKHLDEKLMAVEMSTLLCKGDKLHSELIELLPERCGTDSQLKNFEKVLAQVADFQAPRHMTQGTYVPKPIIWEKYYDPIHTLLRSSNRAEFQVSLDRYQEFVKRSGLPLSSFANIWPPFRIPLEDPGPVPDPRHLLLSNLILEIIFIVLFRAVHIGNVPNFTVALAVYLLELATSINSTTTESEIVTTPSRLSIYNTLDFASYMTNKVNMMSVYQQLQINKSVPEESIVSLLLQLFSQFKENSASYSLPQYTPSPQTDNIVTNGESRIGDGAFFIGNLLNKLVTIFPSIHSAVREETTNSESGSEQSLERDREERRRKAKERRHQLMTEMAMKRQQFMKMNEDANSEEVGENSQSVSEADNNSSSSNNSSLECEFECVICMEKGGSKFENPYGLICYLMPTSVSSHRKSYNVDKVYASLSYTDKSFGEFWKFSYEHLNKNFADESSIRLSFPLDCGNGVSIQTCGHYLHTDCYYSYMNSLKKSRPHMNQDSAQLSNRKFSCPLCRQFGNSFLPIIKDSLGMNCLPSEGGESDENELNRAFKKRSPLVLSPKQKNGLEYFLEDLQKIGAFTKSTTLSEFSEPSTSNTILSGSVTAQNLSYVFLNALEMESLKSKNQPDIHRSYILPLYSVLRYFYKSLPSGHSKKVSQIWETIIASNNKPGNNSSSSSSSKGQRDVPILLKDLNVVLSHLMLQLPYGTEKKYLNLIGQKLMSLKLVQILTALCLQFDLEDLKQAKNLLVQPIGFQQILYNIMECICRFKFNNLTECSAEMPPAIVVSSLIRNASELDGFVNNRLRPFAKKLSELNSLMTLHGESSFSEHCYYSQLISTSNMDSCLNLWIEELLQYRNTSIIPIIIKSHLIVWDEPRFIDIPHEYDRIFQSYRKLKCENCNQMPSEPALCLLCGKIVCLNSFCCLDKQSKMSEVIQHSTECGMGSAVYLCILSSAILVVVGKDACVWGSIFLDIFGEEDLDLRRGKPLFLCKERFQFLLRQWKTHSFHKYELKWFPHDNML